MYRHDGSYLFLLGEREIVKASKLKEVKQLFYFPVEVQQTLWNFIMGSEQRKVGGMGEVET